MLDDAKHLCNVTIDPVLNVLLKSQLHFELQLWQRN